MAVAVPFPASSPAGYEWLQEEPIFDPDRHLQLERPLSITKLSHLGYGADEIRSKATPVAASSPFRVLSDEGADVMLAVARRLRGFARRAGERIERTVRGGCYRSRWLRDLCLSPDLTDHLGAIYGIEIAPHPMPLHLGHLNYDPSQIDLAIDKWHHDTLPLDVVMMVTDPAEVSGGRFEYFLGTKHEAAELAHRDFTPPADRVFVPDFAGPGYAIALHGDMVVHRAAPITQLCERISMVNGYVTTDVTRDNQSRTADLKSVDDPAVLWVEWARFAAWRSKERLAHLVDTLAFATDRDQVVAQLEEAIFDASRAIEEMKASDAAMTHYGG